MKLVVALVWAYTAAAAIVGLDFGQQFTKAVLLSPQYNFAVIETEQGKRKDLSGVCIRPGSGSGDVTRVYGSQTGSLFTRFPQLCVADVKLLLGHSLDSEAAQDYIGHHQGVVLEPLKQRNGAVVFDLGLNNDTYQFSPEEIAAMTFQTIRDRAVAMLETVSGVPIVDVAVTVLPFALLLTRLAYLDALKLANFTLVLGLVDEGLAVALDYILKQKDLLASDDDTKLWFLVYDMGAGSTTATLFSFLPVNNTLEIVEIGADPLFGGKHLTNVVYDIILAKLTKQLKLSAKLVTPKMLARIVELAEKAKLILLANSDTKVLIELIYDERDFKCTITREEFEDAVGLEWSRAVSPITTALEAAGVDASDIVLVVLNGGSTRVPKIQSLLGDLIGEDKISKLVNTDELCAIGTTMRGLQLKVSNPRPNEITLIEHGQSQLNLGIDGGKPIEAFAAGVVAGSTGEIVLDKAPKKLIELYEGDKLFKTIKLKENLQKAADKVKCDKKEEKQVVALTLFDENKLFHLAGLEVRCIEPVVEEPEVVEEEEQEEQERDSEDKIDVEDADDEEPVATKPVVTKPATKRPKRPTKLTIPDDHHYPEFNPMSSKDHADVLAKLTYLQLRDKEKIQLDETRNELEALCYQLRQAIEEKEKDLLKTVEADDLAAHLELVKDTLEWLEADLAALAEVNERLAKIKETHDYLDTLLKIGATDLLYDAMRQLHEDGHTVYSKLLERLDELEERLEQFQQMYEAEGFDWSKEKLRVLKQIDGNSEDLVKNVRLIITDFKTDLDKLDQELDALTPEEYNDKLKHDVYKTHNKIAQHMMNLLTELMTMEGAVKAKVEAFDAKFKTLLKRKRTAEKRKAEKKKKQAEEAAEKAAEDEDKEATEDKVEKDDIPEDIVIEETVEDVKEDVDDEATQKEDTKEEPEEKAPPKKGKASKGKASRGKPSKGKPLKAKKTKGRKAQKDKAAKAAPEDDADLQDEL